MAECTERAALAQQVLSLFGTESYYCMGCLDIEYKQEPHCFNIIKRRDDYAVLDYSVIVNVYNENGIKNNGHLPFIGSLSNEEFIEFINNGYIKNFKKYVYVIGRGKEYIGGEIQYVVGTDIIDKEKQLKNSKDTDNPVL